MQAGNDQEKAQSERNSDPNETEVGRNQIDNYLSKASQITFDLHPGFSHMEDEKDNKLHLFKKYFKMMFLTIQAIIGPYCYSF